LSIGLLFRRLSSVLSPRTQAVSLPIKLVLLAMVAVLYGAFRQQIFTIDSLYYLWDAEVAGWRALLHPHHLLLEPIFRIWLNLWRWFAYSGKAIAPFQVFNMLVTLGSLALFLQLLQVMIKDRKATIIGFWLMAAMYLPWYHATQAEGVPLFAIFAMANLLWAAALPQASDQQRPGIGAAMWLAATITGGILIHQSLVLWSPLLAWMLGREAAPGHRLRTGILCLGTAGAATLAIYVIMGAWATGGLVPHDLWLWFTGYSREFAQKCGSLSYLFSAQVPRGLGSAILTGTPLKAYAFGGKPADLGLLLRMIPIILTGLLLAGGLLGVPQALGRLDRNRRQALINIALLTALGFLFAGWWEPSNRKFWTPVLPGIVVLAMLGWTSLRSTRISRLVFIMSVITIVVMLGFNLVGGILPRHREADAVQPMLQFLARPVQEQDTVIIHEDRVWQCINYFKPSPQVFGIPGAISDRDDPEHTVWWASVAAARQSLQDGHVLYITASIWPDLQEVLELEMGPLPDPSEVLVYGDADLGEPKQILLSVQY